MLSSLTDDVALAKIDIEGAEYETLESTPELWKRIQTILLELPPHPDNIISPESFMKRIRELGFQVEQEAVAFFCAVKIFATRHLAICRHAFNSCFGSVLVSIPALS